MNISYSRVSSYMSCPYSHYLAYEIGLASKKPIRPLHFGSNFHKLLELRNDPEALAAARQEMVDSYYEMSATDQGILGESYLDDLFTIFDDYCEVWKGQKIPTITEKEFNIPLFEIDGEPYIFKGVIDEVYKRKDKGGKYILVGEHKTFSYRQNLDTLVLNAQKNLYAKAIQHLYGMMPRGVIWDYISSKPAAQPVWLKKSKRFSATGSKSITPFSWKRACKEIGITDEKTIAKAMEYEPNISSFFFRVEQSYSERAVDMVWDGFCYQAQMIAKYGMENKTKNLTRNCAYCQYRDLCYAELSEGNVEYTLQRGYIIRPRTDTITDKRKVIDPQFCL